HHDAGHHFALAVPGDGTLSKLRTVAHICDIPDQHRYAGARDNHGLAKVLRCRCLAETTEDVLLISALQVPARRDRVVRTDGLDDIVQGEPVSSQPLWLYGDLYLANESAKSIDLHDARDAAKLGAHDAFVNGPKLHGIVTGAVGSVEIDLRDGARQRAEGGVCLFR